MGSIIGNLALLLSAGLVIWIICVISAVCFVPIDTIDYEYYHDPVQIGIKGESIEITFIPSTKSYEYEYMYCDSVKISKNQTYVTKIGGFHCRKMYDLVIYGERIEGRTYDVWFRSVLTGFPDPHVEYNDVWFRRVP